VLIDLSISGSHTIVLCTSDEKRRLLDSTLRWPLVLDLFEQENCDKVGFLSER